MKKKNSLKWRYLLGVLLCAPVLAACSDDDGDGSGGGNAEISIPASIVDGMQIASVTTSDTENALSIDYNDDGTPASATVGGQVFDFEYEPVTRAAQPTGRKLVHVGARGSNGSWVATNFAFNTDGFLASYQEVMTESGPGYSSKYVMLYTFTYNNKGQLQRIGLTGTDSGTEDGESWSERASAEVRLIYSGDALSEVTTTRDGETLTYSYEYATNTHANTYNKMTPQLAMGMGMTSPILYALANMGYLGNASAFLPTSFERHSYSDYTDGDPNYDERESYDIVYHFYDDNSFLIQEIECEAQSGASVSYHYTYFEKE